MKRDASFARAARLLSVALLGIVLTVPLPSYAEVVEEDPSAAEMVGDVLVARPIGLGITVVGSLVYALSLPFTLAGGNSKEAAETLVLGPARATFVRCLGCKKAGRKEDVIETQTED